MENDFSVVVRRVKRKMVLGEINATKELSRHGYLRYQRLHLNVADLQKGESMSFVSCPEEAINP
ncbi:hypothetical protein BZG82_10125 [Salinivibrio sp. PR5]|nr:hypothetical protein BZG82_10125 [Salinivibrio sp. PR5]OOF10497.1 hypothetical protein BZG83_13850 [Salinivibrio sp. PR919]OOF17875.1 hypothetical protein BZG84_06120 [Salinivibrio sp. PR932]